MSFILFSGGDGVKPLLELVLKLVRVDGVGCGLVVVDWVLICGSGIISTWSQLLGLGGGCFVVFVKVV